MPNTLPMDRPHHPEKARRPAPRIAALTLFIIAYVAILGILLAPEGFFLAQPPELAAID